MLTYKFLPINYQFMYFRIKIRHNEKSNNYRSNRNGR